jgi:hypothetical protein
MANGTCSVTGCEGRVRTRGMCNAHYERMRRHGDLRAGDVVLRRDDPASRLARRVDRSGGADACWPWVGRCVRGGYGILHVGRFVLAHRLAWELERGPIPQGLHVHHVCRNPACTNPRHMELLQPDDHARLHRAG